MMSRTHFGSVRRAPGPLSPPEISQSGKAPCRGKRNGPDRGLIRNELYGRRNGFKMFPSLIKAFLVLRCDAEPHIPIAVFPIFWQHSCNVLRSLCQQQPIEPATLANEFEKIESPFGGDLIIEDIGHRRAKDSLAPTTRYVLLDLFEITVKYRTHRNSF